MFVEQAELMQAVLITEMTELRMWEGSCVLSILQCIHIVADDLRFQATEPSYT